MRVSRFIDKNPLFSYSLGPENLSGIFSGKFETEWSGELIPSKGIFLQNDSSSHFLNYNGQTPDCFSFTFHSGRAIQYSTSKNGVTDVYLPSSGDYVKYTFSGSWGQVYNTFALNREKSACLCVYLKSGIVYSRSSETSFLNESAVNPNDLSIHSLTQVFKSENESSYRASIYGLKKNGDGFSLELDKENPWFYEYFLDFSNCATGETQSLPLWERIEEFCPFFIDGSFYRGDDFSTYSLGENPDFSGIFVDSTLYYYNDMEDEVIGNVSQILGGYFING